MTSGQRPPRFRTELPAELRGQSFTVADARALGVGRGRLQNRSLERPFRGVRVDAIALEPTIEHEAKAAAIRRRLRAHDLQYAPLLKESQAYGAISAARVLGLPLPWPLLNDTRVHLIVPEGRNLPRRPGVVTRIVPLRLWRTFAFEGVLLPHPTLLYCLMSRDLLRSNASAARSDLLSLGDALVTVARNYPNRVWNGNLTTRAALASAVAERSPGYGSSLLREMTPQIREQVESPYESLMRFALHDSGYPELAVQHSLQLGGVELARPDCADLKAKIAYDFEGLGHLVSPSQWRRDVKRARLVTNLGWHGERLTHSDLWPDPSEFIRHAHGLRERRLRLLGEM